MHRPRNNDFWCFYCSPRARGREVDVEGKLNSGKYRVSACFGYKWSCAAKEKIIPGQPGHTVERAGGKTFVSPPHPFSRYRDPIKMQPQRANMKSQPSQVQAQSPQPLFFGLFFTFDWIFFFCRQRYTGHNARHVWRTGRDGQTNISYRLLERGGGSARCNYHTKRKYTSTHAFAYTWCVGKKERKESRQERLYVGNRRDKVQKKQKSTRRSIVMAMCQGHDDTPSLLCRLPLSFFPLSFASVFCWPFLSPFVFCF